MRRVFIDTSAFVALRNKAEREHRPARYMLTQLIEGRARLFTSNYVFAETYTALLIRVGRPEAIEWGRRFKDSNAIELVRVEEDIEDGAWEILERQGDKAWSYVDATCFALMDREGVAEAFSFDRNFIQLGLHVLPPP
ncbi:hypothetical protein BH20ACT22_BH20ACT22_23130 [soil metagenome]